jgi:hypothetical protein
MIGATIILTLIITALATMILLTRQYDIYQEIANRAQFRDAERFAENLRPVSPGLQKRSGTVSCSGQQCNEYSMIIRNHGIGMQLARIYVNSTRAPGCLSPCILDQADNPAPYKFQASDRFILSAEVRNVTFWLPGNASPGANVTLLEDIFGANTVSMITTRGRTFAFQWPIPPLGPAASPGFGGQGATGLYIGPLVITFQKELVAWTRNGSGLVQVPIYGDNGYWVMPPPPLVLYIKVQTDVSTPNDVYLTSQSVLELAKFDSPGNVFNFFIVAPINLNLCNSFASQDPEIVCNPAYGYYAGGNNGDPNNLVAYAACNQPPASYNTAGCAAATPPVGPRYMIPKPTPLQLLNNERGNPVIIAFSARTASGSMPQTGGGGFTPGSSVTSFLGMTYVYNDGGPTGPYVYAVTFPFIAMCVQNPPNRCNG